MQSYLITSIKLWFISNQQTLIYQTQPKTTIQSKLKQSQTNYETHKIKSNIGYSPRFINWGNIEGINFRLKNDWNEAKRQKKKVFLGVIRL